MKLQINRVQLNRLPPRVKKFRPENDHVFPTSAEVGDVWNFTFIPHSSSWPGGDALIVTLV
jgi:hypothetical protein